MQIQKYKYGFLLFVAILSSCVNGQIGQNASGQFKNGMVVSASDYASNVGVEILKKGGNAVDAAVAVQFALAVVYPNAGNLGGGGFMVYRSAKGEMATLDFREKAPSLSTRDMYLDASGNPIIEKSLYGALAAGVPGSVAGMEEAHKKFGKLKWAELIQPSINLAENGFEITARQARELNELKGKLVQLNPLGTNLINKNAVWKEKDKLIQTELATTLKLIRDKGKKGFYEGPVADSIVAEMKRGNGIITLQDLKNYTAEWREPLTGTYRGYKIITMPPPSSGGIALLQLLKSVEPYALNKYGFNSDSTVQLMVEAERRVYADRASYLGDPDYFKVPVQQLLSNEYIQGRMSSFSFAKAGNSNEILAGVLSPAEHEETTHFSIVDREGNAVSLTTTLNGSYGSAVVVKGAGFLLNNEMDDFSVKPGAPNMYGLVGGEANAIEPGKRMLSSMTPTILEKDGKLFMVVGTPGGSTIITSVFQTILNVIDFEKTMQAAVSAKKIHHQWLPDVVNYEEGALDSLVLKKLNSKGYLLKQRGPIGRVDAILITKWGYYQGGADPRGDDAIVAY
ncbi:gamma-glutamyltransferase [Pedobacter flavus]|uniref:Glutathione hydrolase proenzyme n=1 Tax=Pedobacter flavus TaxID=3113906 RepID=A0ABU7GYV8_9SPHI|nr:gamma-glutamyltransferase [Pedobacter sp. VNH31]MEE1884145.1 gamma-glutamyltransferase [Pedobacter sp. VNH31]